MANDSFKKVSYLQVSEGDIGQRIDNFLLRILKQVPKSRVYRILRKGEVRVNAKRAKPEYRLQEGDRIRLPPVHIDDNPPPPAPSHSLRNFIAAAIIFEDADLIVVDKPAGVAVHGGSGISFGVIEALRAARPELTELELVHRLDRDTSGCLLIAKRRGPLRELHALFREREMEKHYLALVCGHWPLGTKTINLPLITNERQGGERTVRVHRSGLTALSVFTPISFHGRRATLMDVSIGTGRTHQIRVHAAACDHPVAGDDKYGNDECNKGLKEDFGLNRMFLHAHSLSFTRPGTDETFSISAPLPEELRAVIERLPK